MRFPTTLARPAGLSRILSPRELMELVGLSPATLWRMRDRGELPEPIRLSRNRVGWREDTISAWLSEREDRAVTAAAARAETRAARAR